MKDNLAKAAQPATESVWLQLLEAGGFTARWFQRMLLRDYIKHTYGVYGLSQYHGCDEGC